MARREGAYGRNAGILRRTLGRGTGLRAGDDWREGRSWGLLKTSLNPAGELESIPKLVETRVTSGRSGCGMSLAIGMDDPEFLLNRGTERREVAIAE